MKIYNRDPVNLGIRVYFGFTSKCVVFELSGKVLTIGGRWWVEHL